MKLNIFLRRTILLVVVLVLLVSMSGCLGLFEEGEKSPEEMREEFVERYDGSFDFFIEASGGWGDRVDTVAFEGSVSKDNTEYWRASGEYIEEDSTGEELSRRYHAAIWRDDGRLNVSVGGEVETLEGVGRKDLGSVYQVNVSNRSRWSFVSPEEELGQLLRSNISRAEGDTLYLKPDPDIVAGLLNKQFGSPMGRQVLDLTGDDFEEVEVRLVRDEPPYDIHQIHIEVETKDGLEIQNSIFLK